MLLILDHGAHESSSWGPSSDLWVGWDHRCASRCNFELLLHAVEVASSSLAVTWAIRVPSPPCRHWLTEAALGRTSCPRLIAWASIPYYRSLVNNPSRFGFVTVDCVAFGADFRSFTFTCSIDANPFFELAVAIELFLAFLQLFFGKRQPPCFSFSTLYSPSRYLHRGWPASNRAQLWRYRSRPPWRPQLSQTRLGFPRPGAARFWLAKSRLTTMHVEGDHDVSLLRCFPQGDAILTLPSTSERASTVLRASSPFR